MQEVQSALRRVQEAADAAAHAEAERYTQLQDATHTRQAQLRQQLAKVSQGMVVETPS